jgi:predicted ribosome quality control (RQC) complex YloA/Tae2 family protein
MKKVALFVFALALAGVSFDAAAQKKETAAQKAQREKTEALQRELDALKNDKSKAEQAAKKEAEMQASLPKEASLIMGGHIQNEGDKTVVQVKPTLGTRGKSRRIEGFSLKMDEPALRDKIKIVYDVNLSPSQDSEKAKKSNDCRTTKAGADGEFAGSKGSACEVIGFRVSLEGEYAKYYTVKYKAHQAELGDSAEYKDGATCGGSKRIEEITVWIEKK